MSINSNSQSANGSTTDPRGSRDSSPGRTESPARRQPFLRTPAATNGHDVEAAPDPASTRDKMLFAANTAILFSDVAAAHAKSVHSSDYSTAWVWFKAFLELAHTLDSLLSEKSSFHSLMNGSVPFMATVEFQALEVQWSMTRSCAGLDEIPQKSKNLDEADWKLILQRVNPLEPDLAVQYYWLCAIALRLLRALGEEEGDGNYNSWAPATNGPAPEALADRPELVAAAPPSGNGTAATEAPTNGRARSPGRTARPCDARSGRQSGQQIDTRVAPLPTQGNAEAIRHGKEGSTTRVPLVRDETLAGEEFQPTDSGSGNQEVPPRTLNA